MEHLGFTRLDYLRFLTYTTIWRTAQRDTFVVLPALCYMPLKVYLMSDDECFSVYADYILFCVIRRIYLISLSLSDGRLSEQKFRVVGRGWLSET